MQVKEHGRASCLSMSAIVLITGLFQTGTSIMITGKVVDGVMKPGMKLNLGKKVVSVSSIVQSNAQVKMVKAGDDIGFTLTNVGPDDLRALQKLLNSQTTLTE